MLNGHIRYCTAHCVFCIKDYLYINQITSTFLKTLLGIWYLSTVVLLTILLSAPRHTLFYIKKLQFTTILTQWLREWLVHLLTCPKIDKSARNTSLSKFKSNDQVTKIVHLIISMCFRTVQWMWSCSLRLQTVIWCVSYCI